MDKNFKMTIDLLNIHKLHFPIYKISDASNISLTVRQIISQSPKISIHVGNNKYFFFKVVIIDDLRDIEYNYLIKHCYTATPIGMYVFVRVTNSNNICFRKEFKNFTLEGINIDSKPLCCSHFFQCFKLFK